MATKKKTDTLTVDGALTHPTVEGATSLTHPNLFSADGSAKTRESHPRLFNKDGSPIDFAARVANRRPDDVILAELQGKRAAALARHVKELAGLDKRIDGIVNGRKRSSRGVDPAMAAEAAQEFLGKGMSVDDILEAARRLTLAAAGVKGKSEEEVEALKAPPAPAFLSVTQPALV